MEFVSSYVHLGHLLTDSLRDSCDILKRRSDFVGQVNNVLCYFQKQRSDVKYKLCEISISLVIYINQLTRHLKIHTNYRLDL